MKIEGRRAQIQKQLAQALEGGLDEARLRSVLESTGATPAEVRTALDAALSAAPSGFAPETRRDVERFLATEFSRTVEASTPGRKVHDVRAQKHQPWWSGVLTSSMPLSFAEPPKDVEIHGERFTKDDVVSMLRGVGR